MLRTSRHYVWGAALLCLNACKSEGDAPPSSANGKKAVAADGCADAPELGWLKTVAAKPGVLEGAGGGWVAFYQRDYRGAAEKFSAAGQDSLAHAGEVRSHIRLGQMYLGLARLVAKTQANYFQAREALGGEATPLKKADYFRGVSALLAGDKVAGLAIMAEIGAGKRRAPAQYKAMARAWPSKCQTTPKAGPAWNQVANLVVCAGSIPACPDKVGAAPAKDPWKTRVALYHAALCADPDTVDEDRLTQMAGTPADDEALQGKGGISATLDYYDPVALWALGQTHLRKAEKLAAQEAPSDRLLKAWAAALRGNVSGAKAALAAIETAKIQDSSFLLLSDFQDATKLAAWIQEILADNVASADKSALAQMRTTEAADVAGAQCVASPEGKKVVAELGLAPSFARTTLRRSAAQLLNKQETCEGALRLLRASQDIKNLESVSYLNEPSFLVSLAEAALCMGRSAEAIGTLRTVKQLYPEAGAALSVAQGLSVVRLMGGTGGTQKIQ